MSMFRKTGENSAEVLLYDDIGDYFDGISAKTFANDLAEVGAVDEITVRINSQGGVITEGFAIYQLLRQHPAKVTTKVDYLAASIASVIAMAGDEVHVAENGFIMIHEPWGVSIGNATEHRKEAALLDQLADSIVGAYAARSSQNREQLLALMSAETWMNATQSIDMGFADKTMEVTKAAAKIDRGRFSNVPEALAIGTPNAKLEKDQRRADAEKRGLSVAMRLRLLDIDESLVV